MPTDPIPRLNAALEGRYRIERELGEGGMATVYLADDLKHERRVALKVLKPELAAVVGAERFLAEIKTTANLQHPHILPLFDSGEADSFLFYVMPYVEGESLRERLDREHQLPVDEAVQIAKNVAEALDHAHKRGVIHRDIKPANILLQSGKPVISDFGIALAVGAAGGGRLTETGLSLGTPHYMSPEQATGDSNVGPAADVYALGCVLYEMLVGEPPYTGGTPQAILGKIITGTPSAVTEHRKSVPANVEAAIGRALETVPADRFGGASDFGRALSDPAFRHGPIGGVSHTATAGLWKRVAAATTSVSLILGVVVAWSLLQPEPELPVSRYSITLPGYSGAGLQAVAIAPGGDRIAWVGSREARDGGDSEAQILWTRLRSDLTAEPWTGTEGATYPAFSPDGRAIAFNSAGDVRVLALDDGTVRRVPVANGGLGLGWGDDGFIYYSDGALGRVPAAGGESASLSVPDSVGELHVWPDPLPGGRGVLFTVGRSVEGGIASYRIAVLDLRTMRYRDLVQGVYARYADSGHLVYVTADGVMMAAPFDRDALELTGPGIAIAQDVWIRQNGEANVSLSRLGTLLYRSGAPDRESLRELVWVSRSGVVTQVDPGFTFGGPGGNYGWRLSPDGARVAFNDASGVWLKYLPYGPAVRLTARQAREMRPFWTPDGEFVTFTDLSGDVWWTRADGVGDPQLVLDDPSRIADGKWSPDGDRLILRVAADLRTQGRATRDILIFRPGRDSTAQVLIGTPDFAEEAPELSSDGRWLAYSTDETGRQEVVIAPFPKVDSTRIPVSTRGGAAPLWARDGRELFYVDAEGALVSVAFDPASGVVGRRDVLFDTRGKELALNLSDEFYDVDLDGQRFLFARDLGAANPTAARERSIVVVENLFQELKAQVPN